MTNKINLEKGDTVDIEFINDECFKDATLIHSGCATGDMWQFLLKNGELFYLNPQCNNLIGIRKVKYVG